MVMESKAPLMSGTVNDSELVLLNTVLGLFGPLAETAGLYCEFGSPFAKLENLAVSMTTAKAFT